MQKGVGTGREAFHPETNAERVRIRGGVSWTSVDRNEK